MSRRSPGRRRTSAPRPMRIGVVTNALAIIGGVERCVLEDTGELVAGGHDVHVWYRPGPTGPADAGRAPYDRMGVRLHLASDFRITARTALRDAARFVRQGLAVRRARLDVLWLNRPEFLPWGRVVAAVAGVPLVVHLHHAPNYRRLGPLASGSTEYLAVSHAMARAWATAGVPPQRITVVPNGVDPDAFPVSTPAQARAARTALGIDDDARTVLYYGRLTRSKGVLALLEAWGRVQTIAAERAPATTAIAADRVPATTAVAADRVPATTAAATDRAPVTTPGPATTTSGPVRRPPLLVLAGALYPEDEAAVRQAIAALPEGSVLLLPERDDVVPLLHAADMVVVPSIEPEGFGRAVVEAMSAGRPVVAAASGGTGEILAGDWARFTVDPEDTEALATTVLDTLDEALLDPELGTRCREWAQEHYGPEPHVVGLLRALRDAGR